MGRSRVGNGKVLIAGIDTHTREYRQYRDVVIDLVEHWEAMQRSYSAPSARKLQD